MAKAQAPAPRDPAARTPLGDIAGGLDVFLYAVRRAGELGRPPVRAALWRRIQHGALDLGWLAALLGALAAFLTLETVGFGLGLGVALGVRVVETLVVAQLAGFACALLVVAGPGVAATFELGLMRHQGELRTLRLIGIDPRDYLIVPCVLGFALALFVLAFAFQFAAILGGFALTALFSHASLSQLFGALAVSMGPVALAVSGAKNLVLGAVIGAIVCNQGLVEPFSPTQMPRIARVLISRALVAMVVVYGGAALLLP
jgi:ABC-type transporter Mla maintaining outer membrane lipid asymmetry permease subunit MlaE